MMSGTTERLTNIISSTIKCREAVESAESEGSSQMENEYARSSVSRSSQFSTTNSSNERDSPSLNDVLNSFGHTHFEQDLFKGCRQYVTRKQRSCQKRVEPITEEQKREESSRNSRNYTRRNREEIEYCNRKLECEKLKLEKLCYEANNSFASQYGSEMREMVYQMRKICEKMYPNFDEIKESLNFSELEEYYDAHEQKKKETHNVAWKAAVYTYEEEFTALKMEYEMLLMRKEQYIAEKGRTNFASAKSRLHQRVLRAEIKRECYIMHCASENMEQKVAALKACDEELKWAVWDVCLSKVDKLLDSIFQIKFDKKDLDTWQSIREFFMENIEQRASENVEAQNQEAMEADEEDSPMISISQPSHKVKEEVDEMHEEVEETKPLMVATPIRRAPLTHKPKHPIVQPVPVITPMFPASTTRANNINIRPPVPQVVEKVPAGVTRYYLAKPTSSEKPSKPPLRMVCLRKMTRDGKTILQPVSVPNSSMIMRRSDGFMTTKAQVARVVIEPEVKRNPMMMNEGRILRRGDDMMWSATGQVTRARPTFPVAFKRLPVDSSRAVMTPKIKYLPRPVAVANSERPEVRKLYVRRAIPGFSRSPYQRPANQLPIDETEVAMPGALLNPNHQNPKIRLGKSVHDPNTISVGQLLKTKLKEEKQNPDVLFDTLRKQLMNPTATEETSESCE